MDRVSTGSGSDLVSDHHATFPTILESHGSGRYRSCTAPIQEARCVDMELAPLWLFVIEGLAIISTHDRESWQRRS